MDKGTSLFMIMTVLYLFWVLGMVYAWDIVIGLFLTPLPTAWFMETVYQVCEAWIKET